MKRYLKIIALLIKLNTRKHLIYRIGTLITLINTTIYITTFWLSINFTFQYTNSILGYSYKEIQLLMWLSQLWWYVHVVIGRKSLNFIDKLISTGTLDSFLLKPLKILPIANFLDFDFRHIPPMIIVMAMIFVEKLIPSPTLSRLLAAFIYIAIGAFISYCMRLLLSIRGFWTGYNVNAKGLIVQLTDIVKLPLDFFGNFTKLVFTVIPVVFLVYPSFLILRGQETLFMLLGAPLSALILYLLAVIFWHKGLKRYTGAG